MPLRSSYIARRRARRLSNGLERLEERCNPAQFGIPWSDATHLTLSFAPDGTLSADLPSELFDALDSQMARDQWQGAMLRAAQLWSEAANVNMGLVADEGFAFGTSAPVQGDSRFGDIRVGGYAMDASELAVASPPGLTTGSFAGDLFINTAADFSSDDLLGVALHELGHALGLPHSADSSSVMFSHLNHRTKLSTGDVTAIRALYGARSLDLHVPNNSQKDAFRLGFSLADGTTPFVAYGDLGQVGDFDYFSVTPVAGYSGPLTVTLKTSEISLLQPRLTLLDARGAVLASAQSVVAGGDTLVYRLPRVVADERVYVRVEAASGAAYRVGRYALGATFDQRVQPSSLSLDEVLRGSYEALSPERIDLLFRDPALALWDDDSHVNETVDDATVLRVDKSFDRDLDVIGSLSDATDVDYYRVRTPGASNGAPWVLFGTARAEGEHGVVPNLLLVDDRDLPVATEVLIHDDGTFAMQARGIAPNRSYFLRVTAADGAAGNYSLHLNFGVTAASLNDFVAGTTAGEANPTTYRLYIAQSQLLSLLLAAQGGDVTMTIRDASGAVVHQLAAANGETRSAASPLLTPGEYTVSFASAGRANFRLRGLSVTDPIGPVLDSATFAPQYVDTSLGETGYFYPEATSISLLPYYWSLLATKP